VRKNKFISSSRQSRLKNSENNYHIADLVNTEGTFNQEVICASEEARSIAGKNITSNPSLKLS